MHSSSARRRRRSIGTAIAGAITATLVLASCTPGAEQDGGPAPDAWELTVQTPQPSGDIDSFAWALYAEPYSLDYVYSFDYADNQVLANICESLLRLEPDFSLSPGLAASFSHPDPLTWVYEIREGVTFHDGTPLTAADAVASMSRHLDPEIGSSWYSVYQNVTDISQTGPMEVTVTTAIPDSQFNLGMGGAAGVIESAATLAEKGADYGNSTGLVNCTGPFELTDWKSGERITLTRYDDYWDPELKAKAKTMEFVIMNDSSARLNALRSGDVDGSWMVPTDALTELRSSDAGDLYFGLHSAVSSLIVSNLEGPLGDVRVRKAMMMALDREGILQAAGRGYGEVTTALTTPSVWGLASEATRDEAFSGLEEYPHDVDAARALVEEAGKTGEEVVIRTAPLGADFSVVAQATAAAAESIGLVPKIETVTPDEYTYLFFDAAAREGADLFYTVWYLSSPDPLEMYGILRTGEFSNYGNWSDPEFDALVNQALGTEDPDERAQITTKLQKIANDQLPWLPLTEGPMTVFLSKRITGLSPSINFLYYPWAATLGAR